jgi:exodeoxyribonuclease V alpha subunit
MRKLKPVAGTVEEVYEVRPLGSRVRLATEVGKELYLTLPSTLVPEVNLGQRVSGFAWMEEGGNSGWLERGLAYYANPWFSPKGGGKGGWGHPWDSLAEAGLESKEAEAFWRFAGPMALEAFRTEPYLLAWALRSFVRADERLRALGMPREHPSRLSAFAEYAVTLFAERTGSTATPLSELEEICKGNIDMLQFGLSYAEERGSLVILGDKVALSKYARWERESVQHLLTPKASPVLRSAFALEQGGEAMEALAGVLKGGKALLLGGAGTGKTTLIRKVAEAYRGVTLLAPTGKAAKRLEEVTGLKTKTIHAFLLDREVREEPVGLLVVDEFSMVSSWLLWALLGATGYATPLLFVGDPFQLPPVDPGHPIAEMESFVPKVELAKSHRFDQGLGKLLEALRGGKGDPRRDWGGEKMEGLEILPLGDSLLEEALAEVDGLKRVFLTPLKGGKYGSVALNAKKLEMEGRGDLFTAGSLVMAVNSDPVLGVVNGDTFRVEREENGLVYTAEGKVILPEHRHLFQGAYALTVHRSQGSEWDEVFVVLPKEGLGIVDRRWLYTALTRARKRVVVFSEGDALYEAMGRSPSRRLGLLGYYARALGLG